MIGMVISAILTFFWALMIDVAQSSTEYAVEGAEPVSTMIPVVCVILGIISFIMFYKKRKKEKMMKEAEKAEKLEKGYLVKATFKHTTGLPFPEGSLFSVYLKENAYAFERNSSTFNLPFEKITDVTITTSTELQKSYASSVGGALGGAVLFGTLGAMVGGRAKEKTSTVEYKYLVFTYQKDNDVDYISFDVTLYKTIHKHLSLLYRLQAEYKLEEKYNFNTCALIIIGKCFFNTKKEGCTWVQ